MNKKLLVLLMVLIPLVMIAAFAVLVYASDCDKREFKIRRRRKKFF